MKRFCTWLSIITGLGTTGMHGQLEWTTGLRTTGMNDWTDLFLNAVSRVPVRNIEFQWLYTAITSSNNIDQLIER